MLINLSDLQSVEKQQQISKFRMTTNDRYEIICVDSSTHDRVDETSNVPILSLSGRCRITCKCSENR